jgi:hypothetical protein
MRMVNLLCHLGDRLWEQRISNCTNQSSLCTTEFIMEKSWFFIILIRYDALLIMISVNFLFVLVIFVQIRIVISTANLIQVDYDRKTQVLANECCNNSWQTSLQGVWYEDFPRKPANAPKTSKSDFEATLEDYLFVLGKMSTYINLLL